MLERINKKRHPLRSVYGFAMFLIDKFIWRFILRFQKGVAEKIKVITVREEVGEELYLYLLQKASVCIITSFAIILVGYCMCIVNERERNEVITLDRPAAGTEVSYGLEAVVEDEETESIEIVVQGAQYTDEEIEELIENSYEKVLKVMLGENESQDYVDKDLNLISSLDNGINITWNIDNTDAVDYNGCIGEDIDENGEVVKLTAEIAYRERSIDYEIACCVYPQAKEDQNIEDKVQEIADAQDKNGGSEVVLPSEIDGKQVSFYNAKKMEAGVFLVLALLVPIVIFLVKDRALDSEVRRRDVQMMCDYPEIVGKLQLLITAGMTVNNAWARIVADYEKSIVKRRGMNNKRGIRYAYEEMRLAFNRMNSGISEIECYNRFGIRCKLHPYLKLSRILSQNVKRGTKGVNKMLEEEVQETFEQRKSLAKKLGEEASTKLLAPMLMMLIITIVIIIFPALANIKI